MSRYLVTLKPEKYHTPNHSYAILAEIDWQTQEVVREIRFPSAYFSTDQAYMSPVIGGVCAVGNRIFVALWNYIVEIEYTKFRIVNSFSHSYAVDLHGINTDGEYLYVASTGIDALLCFDIDTFELQWRWGPDEPILYHDRVMSQLESDTVASIPGMKSLRQESLIRQQAFVNRDYRYQRKGMTGYHHHHLNDVIIHGDHLYITTKQWNHQQRGAIIKLNAKTRKADFFVEPDSLDGLHDGVWYQDKFCVTESGANQVAWCDEAGQVKHQKIEPSPYFVRGLCDTGESWLVGFSTLRNTELPAQIVEYNRNFTEKLSAMDVSHFYPREKSTAIHTIIKSPEGQ